MWCQRHRTAWRLQGLKGASLVAQTVKSLPAVRETRVRPLGQEDPPGEGNGHPLQYSCLENPMDTGVWWASPWGRKSWTWMSDSLRLNRRNQGPRCHLFSSSYRAGKSAEGVQAYSLILQKLRNLSAERRIPGFGISSSKRLPTPVFLPGKPPWTEKLGGLQSMGLQRVGHDWATEHIFQAEAWWPSSSLSLKEKTSATLKM